MRVGEFWTLNEVTVTYGGISVVIFGIMIMSTTKDTGINQAVADQGKARSITG